MKPTATIMLTAAVTVLMLAGAVLAEPTAKPEHLTIAVIGNHHSSQNRFLQQLEFVAEHADLAKEVHTLQCYAIYGHGHLPDDADNEKKGLSWLRGEGVALKRNGEPLTGRHLKRYEPFLGSPPDVALVQVGCGRASERAKGGGLERIIEVTAQFAEVCAQNKVRMVLWIHPGIQHNHKKNKKKPEPLTEDDYAAALERQNANLAKIMAAVRAKNPEVELIPWHEIFSRFRKANPGMNIQPPEGDPNGHLSGRDHYFLACLVTAALGAPKPAALPDLDAANKILTDKYYKHQKEAATMTAEQQLAIHAVAWAGKKEPSTEQTPE